MSNAPKLYASKIQPVELGKGEYHIILRAKIAGLPVRCVLDTGASHSCLDINFVREQLPAVSTLPGNCLTAGIGGHDFEVNVADIPEFKIGRFRLPLYPNMALLDMAHINAAYVKLRKKPVQLILGNDFFVKYHAVIDYPRQCFSFYVSDRHDE